MKILFDSAQIISAEIRNRFFVAPMSRVSADLQGVPSFEMQEYYTAFATWGFGGIPTVGLYLDHLFLRSFPTL